MVKNELENYDVVITRDGEHYIYIEKDKLLLGLNKCLRLCDYNFDLTFDCEYNFDLTFDDEDNNLDIVKILRNKNVLLVSGIKRMLDRDYLLDVIYDREEEEIKRLNFVKALLEPDNTKFKIVPIGNGYLSLNESIKTPMTLKEFANIVYELFMISDVPKVLSQYEYIIK